MNTTTTIQQITDIINDMNEAELIQLNNEYCEAVNYYDNEIYENDEYFFNAHFEGNPMAAVRAANYGNYNYTHSWVIFNGYGNLETFDTMTTEHLSENVEVIAEYIADNLQDFTQFDNVEETEEN